MESVFRTAWQNALEAEKLLLNCLDEREPTFTEISHFVLEFRNSCQSAILEDFEAARSLNAEGRLWDAHLKINSRFRKLLLRYRDDNAKNRPVEKRKLEKRYLDFIKSSQRFYRGYIQRLSSQFGGIPELEKVAQKFSFDSLSAHTPIKTPDNLRKLILQSCHATLIRLGDLSRYRETELVSKDRNWGPAIGYYDLAAAIYPASGASHNQLAVIALADGNHLRATYHLYRALAAVEPHPSAKGNLEIEFKKIKNAWTKGELIRREDAGIPGRAFGPWFSYLHAQCYKGIDFPEHDELESEVLSQLAVDLKERSLEGTLQKFCLVNIAAEDFAKQRVHDDSACNARYFFQRLNVKAFFMLLQILLAELERFAFEDSDDKDARPQPDKVTIVARRILPALRHYSSWLLTVSDDLVALKEEKDSPLFVQIKEFWKIYANTLSLLASTFDVASLPEIDYLLEEDEDTLGFAPLAKEATARRYMDEKGHEKPRMHDPGVARSHPSVEMSYRIREFVIDGLDLVVSNKIPVVLIEDNDKKTFIYQEEGLPSQVFASPLAHQDALSSTNLGREDLQQITDSNSAIESKSVYGESQSASASMSANMTRIVEGVERLVESDTCEGVPSMPEYLGLFKGSELSITPARPFGTSTNGPFNDNDGPPLRTVIAPPPGLPAPMHRAPTSNPQASPSWTLRPVLPGISSIWNTTEGDSSAPGSSLRLDPMRRLCLENSTGLANRESAAADLVGRSNGAARSLLESSQDGVDSINTSWPSMDYSLMNNNRLSGMGWERTHSNRNSYLEGARQQPLSSNSTNFSWANNSFIGNGFSSSLNYSSSGFSSSEKPASKLGAIGQTPPSGQGG